MMLRTERFVVRSKRRGGSERCSHFPAMIAEIMTLMHGSRCRAKKAEKFMIARRALSRLRPYVRGTCSLRTVGYCSKSNKKSKLRKEVETCSRQ